MNEKLFKILNNAIGWLVFIVAAITYLMTIEPTVSFWDCGEFISSSNKLQIGHPPGAPFFMIIARLFAIFASDVTQVAAMVNRFSALASAFTILFLFWTITFFAKRMIAKDKKYSVGNVIAILACGVIGALAYTFSDTFWFSAVEGEVYAFSSFFTAIVFWAITKWCDSDVEDPTSKRWILLIALLEGMAIGVHLLNLLTLPAIAFVVYYKKYKPTFWGFVITTLISLLAIAVIMWGIIPGVAIVASKFELLFTNSFGMPFNTGLVVWTILTSIVLVLSIYFSQCSKNKILNTVFPTIALLLTGAILFTGNTFFNILIALAVIAGLWFFVAENKRELLNMVMLFVTMLMIGYSSYAIIIIRSNANPPMDQNSPDDVFNLLSYLNREQYGDRPLVYGQYYNANFIEYENTSEIYTKRGDKYVCVGHRFKPVFDKKDCTIFPRMHSREEEHIRVYRDFGGMKKSQKKPTFANNIQFFVNYQMNWMYWRYFMWNFAGRQNDIQGHGNTIHGNWISGFKALDNARLGDQDLLPDYLKENKANNRYFMLPLLLGLIGLAYQLWKHLQDWWIVSLLFILTGIAIVVYLNQTPIQPRERDYAYAGSFYAFAIWIGLGVAAIYKLFEKFTPAAVAGTIGLLICAPVPYIMAEQNWDDHDRSNRYAAHDFARNYLETCAPNAILFTHGDNDTFPVWYAQEVEGIRPDIKICCLPYFASDWYIDQMKAASYDAQPMPLSMDRRKYEPNTRDQILFNSRLKTKGYMPLPKFMEYLKDDQNCIKSNNDIFYLFPNKKVSIKVDPQRVIETGNVYPRYYNEETGEIFFDTIMKFDLNREYLLKNEMMILDMLNTNNWERPVYITSLGSRHTLNLDKYYQCEGFAYRLTPIDKESSMKPESVKDHTFDTEVLYNNMMNVYTWGNINDPKVYVDQTIARTTNIVKIRSNFGKLAEALAAEGKIEKAQNVMNRCDSVMPARLFPISYFDCEYLNGFYKSGMEEYADSLVEETLGELLKEVTYYQSLPRQKMAADFNDIQLCVATFGRILSVAQRNSRNDLIDEYYETYTLLSSWMNE